MQRTSFNLFADLLAVIHRDGGHYTELHGFQQSAARASKIASEHILLEECLRSIAAKQSGSYPSLPAGKSREQHFHDAYHDLLHTVREAVSGFDICVDGRRLRKQPARMSGSVDAVGPIGVLDHKTTTPKHRFCSKACQDGFRSQHPWEKGGCDTNLCCNCGAERPVA
jgi:hypothetical protein